MNKVSFIGKKCNHLNIFYVKILPMHDILDIVEWINKDYVNLENDVNSLLPLYVKYSTITIKRLVRYFTKRVVIELYG